GRDENFPFRFERLALYARDPGRILILRRWKEHSHKAFGHHVEDRALVVVKQAGNSAGGNNRKVIAHFRVVEDPFIWLDPIVIEDSSREWIIDFAECRSDCGKIIFRQSARIRARVGDGLVFLVKRLRDLQRAFCGETESAVCFALQRSEIVELRSDLRAWLLFFELDDAMLASALALNALGDFVVPQ